MRNIGLLSDLHLEGSNIEINNPGWDCLVIAGDLSSDLDNIDHFFYYCAPKDIPIIYVLGNHEFEGKRLDLATNKIRDLLKPYENVHLLDNESIVINGVKFIGTTLWSNFESAGMHMKKEEMNWAKFHVVDFSSIFDKNDKGKYVPINPEKMIELNKKAYQFLEFELKKNEFNGPKIVVSHFAPHKNSIHSSYENKMSSYWVNHLEELLGFSDYWFHGHTHNSFDYTVEGTRVVCNPRGFSRIFNMAQNQNFNKELILSLDNYYDLSNILDKKNKI